MSILDLVLLPGLLCDRALWEAQVGALSDRARIAVGDITGADTLGALADSVLAAAPPRFALAGLSMGGYVAFEIVRRAPERLLGLALLDTSARPDTPEYAAMRRTLMRQAQIGAFKGVTPRLLPRWIHPAHMKNAALVDAVTAMTKRVGREAFLRQQAAILGRPDSRPDLPRIACPTLVLCGRQDEATPLDVHEEMAAGIAGARLAVIEECGHLSTMEQPDAVTAAMATWLDALGG